MCEVKVRFENKLGQARYFLKKHQFNCFFLLYLDGSILVSSNSKVG